MPARPPPDLIILICVHQDGLRDQVIRELTEKALRPIPAIYQGLAIQYPKLHELQETLEMLFRGSAARGVVVVSDRFAEEDSPGQLISTPAARELFALFSKRLYATVALADIPGTVPDVDRVVPIDAIRNTLCEAVRLCFARLAYLRRPNRPLDPSIVDISIRELRSEEELRPYFKLRFNTYRAMCYLDPLVEKAHSGMEIDWFDTRSYHFGAYASLEGRNELIGTARLIVSVPLDEDRQQQVRRIADSDPVLSEFVRNGAIQSLLPVLQSQRLARVLASLAQSGAVVGELSRVVVDPSYRGRGLSIQMVEAVIGAALRNQVSDLLLECLPTHRGLYERCQFQLIPRLRGNVYLINRTMIVMHRTLGDTSALPPMAAGRTRPVKRR